MEEDKGEAGCFILILLFGILLGGIIYSITVEPEIRTKEPITPEIELTVDNNVIDTIYIYRAK